ncbi:ABC transporter ATP-binding protein [Frankia sp. AgB1.9]|nr:ABC transporter ATP-binding protein [Frankia sp. AgW1.1]MBL7547594.1 ABC transporter ATP-binding protein [Frankia sp. AgB1.9]MBL7619515.1 ABC transporter ATP-binding protein [Frankia sp. AgB1.8]
MADKYKGSGAGVSDPTGVSVVGGSTVPPAATAGLRVPLVPRATAWLLGRLTGSTTARRSVRFFDDAGPRLVAIVAMDLAGALSFAAAPFILRHLIDTGLTAPHGNSALIVSVAALLVVALLQALANAVSSVLSSGLGELVGQRAGQAVHDQLLRVPFAFFPGQRQGELFTLFGRDADEIETAVAMVLPRAVTTAISAVVGVATIAVLDWRLAAVSLVLAPGVFALLAVGRREGRSLSVELIKLRVKHFAQIGDTTGVSGALHIRLFDRTEHESRRYAEIADGIRRTAQRRNQVNARAQLMSSAGSAVAVVIVVGFGSWLVSTDRATIGTLLAFASALVYAYRPVTGLAESRSDLLDAGVAFERVFGLLDVDTDVRDLPVVGPGRAAAAGTPSRGPLVPAQPGEADAGYARTWRSAPEIRIEDLWFRYERDPRSDWTAAGRELGRRWWDVQGAEAAENRREEAELAAAAAADAAAGVEQEWALRNLNLVAAAGAKTAIVGASGAGKSTLGGLLAGLYLATRGHIRCDGEDLATMDWRRLRSIVGVVPQDPYMFHDTIAANIRYGRIDATNAELEAAALDAGLGSLLEKLPKRLETVVGARGYQLSGGERQRVALARVLLADPPMLVLDEATSQLDSVTEQIVQEALARLGVGRTRVVIAHRLSTIVDADVIHVMADGQVVESGTHDDLLARGGAYAHLYARQVGDDDPARS